MTASSIKHKRSQKEQRENVAAFAAAPTPDVVRSTAHAATSGQDTTRVSLQVVTPAARNHPDVTLHGGTSFDNSSNVSLASMELVAATDGLRSRRRRDESESRGAYPSDHG